MWRRANWWRYPSTMALVLLCGALFGCTSAPASPNASVVLDPNQSGDIWSLAFSPDGTQLATSGPGKILQVWRVADGVLMYTLESPSRSVVWNANGDALISGDSDAAIRVWDVTRQTVHRTLTGHSQLNATDSNAAGVITLALSRDGDILASGGADRTVRLWDLRQGKEFHTLKNFPDRVVALTISPEGDRLATGGWSQAVKVWDINSGRELLTLDAQLKSAYGLSFSPDGKWLATGGDEGVLQVWDAASGMLWQSLNAGEWLYGLAFTPTGRIIAAGCQDATIRRWSVIDGQSLPPLTGHTKAIYTVAFSPDGALLASAGKDGTLRLWNAQSGEPIRVIDVRATGR